MTVQIRQLRFIMPVAIAGLLLFAAASHGDDAATPPDPPAPGSPPSGLVELNLPKSVSLDVMVDYVSKRLGMNILYDDQVSKQKVTVLSPKAVPVDSLPGLLDSMLAMKGLARVPTDQEGW